MKNKNVAILGGGTVGFALAAEFFANGFNVNMLEMPAFEKNIEPLIEKKEIRFSGSFGDGSAKLNMVTTNVEKALRDVVLIILASPAFGHKAFFEACIPYLKDGQIFLTFTGYFAGLRFGKAIKDTGKNVMLAEVNISPYTVIKTSPTQIFVHAKKKKSTLAALPGKEIEKVYDLMKAVYPEIIPVSNVLYTSLDCVNWMVHPPKTLLHKGLIERTEYYSLPQKDSIPPSVIKLIETMDVERIALGKAFGLNLPPIKDFWESGGKTIHEAIMGSEEVKTYAYEFKDGWVRYLEEDVYYALPPLISLARLAKVPVPLFEAILHIFSVITGADYMKEGATVEKMGLAGLSIEEINKILEEGF